MKPPAVLGSVSGQCANPDVCPLSHIRPGTTVFIKRLAASPELSERLRELGFCERRQIRLLSCDSNFICQVCNARLGISQKLAESIWVEAPSGLAPLVALPNQKAGSRAPARRKPAGGRGIPGVGSRESVT